MKFPMTLQIGDVTVYIPINDTHTKACRNLDAEYTDQEWLEYHINEALGFGGCFLDNVPL